MTCPGDKDTDSRKDNQHTRDEISFGRWNGASLKSRWTCHRFGLLGHGLLHSDHRVGLGVWSPLPAGTWLVGKVM